jgi:hypothetical protein
MTDRERLFATTTQGCGSLFSILGLISNVPQNPQMDLVDDRV